MQLLYLLCFVDYCLLYSGVATGAYVGLPCSLLCVRKILKEFFPISRVSLIYNWGALHLGVEAKKGIALAVYYTLKNG